MFLYPNLSLFPGFTYIHGEPELTDSFNLLINGKLRTLGSWNLYYLKEEHFYGNIVFYILNIISFKWPPRSFWQSMTLFFVVSETFISVSGELCFFRSILFADATTILSSIVNHNVLISNIKLRELFGWVVRIGCLSMLLWLLFTNRPGDTGFIHNQIFENQQTVFLDVTDDSEEFDEHISKICNKIWKFVDVKSWICFQTTWCYRCIIDYP